MQTEPVAVEVDAAPAVALATQRWPPPALRVRAFRWYWGALWPVFLGTWMQIVALGFFVYRQTNSTAAVGAVAAANGLPAMVMSTFGGVLADRLPRRQILLATQSVLASCAGTLAILVATHHASLAVVIVVAAVFGSANSIDLPTRQAMVADLVGRNAVVNAEALTAVAMSVTRIVGPAVAGLLISITGPAVCFAVLSLAYIAPLSVLVIIVPNIPPVQRDGARSPFGDVVDLLRELRRNRLVLGITTCGATLSFFGVSYMPYLPVYANDRLHAGSRVLGVLYATGGVGALVGSLVMATVGGSVATRRLLLLGGSVIYAASLFSLASSSTLVVALPALIGISLGFLSMNTSMVTLLQTETDPALRGRLLGVYVTILAGLQPMGTLFYGLFGHSVFRVISIGALVVGGVGLFTALGPALRAERPA